MIQIILRLLQLFAQGLGRSVTARELLEELGEDITVPVTSEAITSVRYKMNDHEMTVTFKDTTRYKYEDVPEIVFFGMVTAESCGSYFNENVRDEFDYTPV